MRKKCLILFFMILSLSLFSEDFGNVYILRPLQITWPLLDYEVEINQNNLITIESTNRYTNIKLPVGEQIIYCYYFLSGMYSERNGVYLNIEPGKDYYVEISYNKNNKPLNITVINEEKAKSQIEKTNIKFFDYKKESE